MDAPMKLEQIREEQKKRICRAINEYILEGLTGDSRWGLAVDIFEKRVADRIGSCTGIVRFHMPSIIDDFQKVGWIIEKTEYKDINNSCWIFAAPLQLPFELLQTEVVISEEQRVILDNIDRVARNITELASQRCTTKDKAEIHKLDIYIAEAQKILNRVLNELRHK